MDYQLPIIAILQYPYFLVNEEIAHSLFGLITDIYDKSEGVEKLSLDSDIDYPGLFLLLVNDNKKVIVSHAKLLKSDWFGDVQIIVNCY